MTLRLANFNHNCVPTALHLVTGKSEHEVLEACGRYGFNGTSGMYQRDWLKAADDLGAQLVEVEVYRYRLGNCADQHRNSPSLSLKEFCQTYSEGVFLVTVPRHMLVVNNGIIVDVNAGRNAARRRVRVAHRVLNSTMPAHRPDVLPKDPVIRFLHTPTSARRWGTAGYQRYYTAWTADPMRLSDVLAASEVRAARKGHDPYTRKDFRSDLRKGHVIIVPEEV